MDVARVKTTVGLFLIFLALIGKASAQPSDRSEVFLKKASTFLQTNFDSCVYYSDLAFDHAEAAQDKRGMALAILSRGNAYLVFNQQLAVLDTLTLQGIRLAESVSDSLLMAKLHNLRGGYFITRGRGEQTLNSYETTLRLARSVGDTELQVLGLAGIANYHYQNRQFEKALGYRKKIFTQLRLLGDSGRLATAYTNLAYNYTYLDELDSAVHYIELSLTMNQALGRSNSLLVAHSAAGEIRFRRGELDKALDHYLEALALEQHVNNKGRQATIYFGLGSIYLDQNRLDEAMDAVNLGLQAATEAQHTYVQLTLYQLKADIARAQGDAEEVHLNYGLFVALQDSIASAEKEKQRIQLEESFNAREREREIELLQQRNEIQSLNNRVLVISGGSLLVLLLLLAYAQRKRARQKQLEFELSKAEQQKLTERVDYQNRELASKALQIHQKNESVKTLTQQLDELAGRENLNEQQLRAIKRSASEVLRADDDWEYFNTFFIEVHPDFFNELDRVHEKLTSQELRQAALLKMGMSLKESAAILNIEPQSVKMARIRLKKKLNLASDQDLGSYLRQLGNRTEI